MRHMRFRCFLLLLICIASRYAFALQHDNSTSPARPGNETIAVPENKAKTEISCYALPYGGLGFASHLLTYITVFLLSRGRTPLMPWRPLEGERFRKWNLAGAALNAAITWPISIVSMVKCSGAWPFILVAVWKLVFSATLTIMSAHATYIASGGLDGLGGFDDSYDFDDWKPHRGQFGKIWWWSVFYFFGALVGFVGVVAIVGEGMPGNETLVWITVGFGVGVGLIAAFVALATCPSRGSGDTKGRIRSSYLSLGVGVTAMTVLFALYSDWALAAVAGDLVGTPTKDNEVLYYFYWVAKRFPMFSL